MNPADSRNADSFRTPDFDRVLLDTSFLGTRRGRVWTERALRQGNGPSRIAVPETYFNRKEGSDQNGDWRRYYFGGFLRVRSAEEIWGDVIPSVDLIRVDDPGCDHVADRLLQLGMRTAAEIWTGLEPRTTLVSRRSRLLDVLVTAGVEVRVTAGNPETAIQRRVCFLDGELAAALLRRTRFLSWREPVAGPSQEPVLRAIDLGWDRRY